MKVKLVCFDWDGTLAKFPAKSSWELIENELGATADAEKLRAMFYNNETDFLRWCDECVNLFKKFNLTKRKLAEILEKNFSLHKGVLETINQLKAKGIKTGIISGGLANTYEYIANKSGLAVDYITFATKLEFDAASGKLIGGTKVNSDFQGKVDILKSYCKKERISLEEVLYVGNEHNDIPVFRVCKGVAFSSDSEELKKQAKYVLEDADMRGLLAYV